MSTSDANLRTVADSPFVPLAVSAKTVRPFLALSTDRDKDRTRANASNARSAHALAPSSPFRCRRLILSAAEASGAPATSSSAAHPAAGPEASEAASSRSSAPAAPSDATYRRVGSSPSYADACRMRDTLQVNGYPDAFVVAFENGTRIPLEEAMKRQRN